MRAPPEAVILSREDDEGPRIKRSITQSSSRDLQSLWEVPLFVRDDDAAWRASSCEPWVGLFTCPCPASQSSVL